jgi:pimeloyl-[acyl-carrier protein] methyl ester esterase
MMMTRAEFRVEVTGSGPDLALLHGWGMHSGLWSTQLDWLQRRYRVHRLDLPGHGFNQGIEMASDLDEVARLIAEHLPPCHLVGWSLGGLVAQKIALNDPQRCRSLTLVASHGCFVNREGFSLGMAPEVFDGFAQSLKSDTAATLNRFIALEVHGSDTMKQDLLHMRNMLMEQPLPAKSALESGLHILQQTDLRSLLSSLHLPCQLIGGTRDRLVRPQAMETLAGQIEGARLCLIQSAGHAPFIGHPKQFRMALESFLGPLDQHA